MVEQNTQNNPAHHHAIVIGGGFGGLLAAKALSKHFEKVTVVERDPETATGTLSGRDGVPQGSHAHLLIPIGLVALEKLLPEFSKAIVKSGAHSVDLFQDVRVSDLTNFKVRFKSDEKILLMSRALAEETVRSLVKEIPNIQFEYHCLAKGLLADIKENRITGVRLENIAKKEDVNLYADLIVDASGARSSAPDWLEALGFDRPIKTEVKIDYIQISRRYRFPSDYKPDWKYTIYRFATLRKGAYVMQLEDAPDGTQWLVAFVSHFGEPIANTEEGFLEFAGRVVEPEFHAILKKSTPLTPIKQFSAPFTRKYSYAKIKRLPTSFIAIGDAVCIWAPHTGLGLATCAEEAVNLDLYLAKEKQNPGTVKNRDFFQTIEKRIDFHWNNHIEKDVKQLLNPKKSMSSKFKTWYKKSFSKLCNEDPNAWKASFDVALSEKPSSSIFRPAIFFRVMRAKLKGK